ncbi:hypothetical protein AB751O23_AK_00060 [Chlamydiales bacterium SCGC AB-751-O23]|nr:hypothetical protein AB751O23_AK_00060 [Chlamydiales bacterium SCGC AB-751-O23]
MMIEFKSFRVKKKPFTIFCERLRKEVIKLIVIVLDLTLPLTSRH